MADDIVNRLRGMASDRARHSTHYDGCDQSHLECVALHAADEIERLRAAGDALAHLYETAFPALGIDWGGRQEGLRAWQEARRD